MEWFLLHCIIEDLLHSNVKRMISGRLIWFDCLVWKIVCYQPMALKLTQS